MFLGRYKTLWLDASDPDETGDDETLETLKVSCLYVLTTDPKITYHFSIV